MATLAVTAALLPPDVPLLAAGPSVVEVRVSSSADDAEEKATGSVSLGSSDLELTLEASTQTVGVRFGNLGIPQGAAISTAWMQFQADETNSEVTDLVIRGEAVDDAPVFSTTSQNITSRSVTSAAVSWSPLPWLLKGEAGPDQATPDLATVVQEIVDRPGWSTGNSLVLIISGTGKSC